MKTKVNLMRWVVFTSVMITLSLSAWAVNPESVNLVTLKDGKVSIIAQNPQKQMMSIEISNHTTGELEFSKDLSNDESYKSLYNLSGLPEGFYTLKYRINNRIYEKVLALKGSKTELLAETSYILPSVSQNNGKLLVTVPNPDNKRVSVSFLKDSESFFTDNPHLRKSFKRNYNLENLDPGEYTVQVTTGGEDYDYHFEVK